MKILNVIELDQKTAYMQVTHVTPFFIKDELEIKQNDFEQNHDIDTFMFETPFTKNHVGPRCSLVEDQWKRRTILTCKRVPIKISSFKLIANICSKIQLSICTKAHPSEGSPGY